MPIDSRDVEFMRRAIELSKLGFPAPNPHVGCVIVRDDKIVGEGFHDYAGGPHAEVVALEAAGTRATGATAYVTQEPCNHQGRTPPCSQALIRARIARVVFAVADPNPKGKGGAETLRNAGIEVEKELSATEVHEANYRWLSAMSLIRPYVTIKAAISLDGRMATASGESKWITGEAARERGRLLRAELGAVLVGRKTIENDDPKLTVRDAQVRNQPLRIVLDPSGLLQGTEKVFSDESETLWVVAKATSSSKQTQIHANGGQFDLSHLFDNLWNQGVTGMLVEGGPETISRFFASDLVDEVQLFVAPKVIGSGVPWAGDWNKGSLESSTIFDLVLTERLGPDLRLVYRRKIAQNAD